MKKISLLALAVTISAALFAQETQRLVTPMATATRFGLRAGVNLADLRFKDLPSGSMITEAQSKTSFNAGAFVNIPLSRAFRFQPEVSFSSQGGKLQGPSSSAMTYGEQDLHYINVPLNFQLVAANGLFLQTGPQVGYLVASKRKNMSGSTSEMDTKDQFDKIDLSWGAGVGYMSRVGLGIDLRYNYGIANIMEDNMTSDLKGTVKNSVGQFSLIYQFGASK